MVVLLNGFLIVSVLREKMPQPAIPCPIVRAQFNGTAIGLFCILQSAQVLVCSRQSAVRVIIGRLGSKRAAEFRTGVFVLARGYQDIAQADMAGSQVCAQRERMLACLPSF